MTTDERVFGGFVYAVEDCYSYLAKMRQGAEGAWLFHIAYTPEPHPGALFFLFHLLLGKVAANAALGSLPVGALTSRMVLVYHLARCIFGLGLLLTVYRFVSTFTERLLVRRLAWVMITFGGGLGWLLVFLGRSNWFGSLPLDFILPEGFTFLVLYAFPHIALARTLLLWGLLSLLTAWWITPAPGQRSGSPAGGVPSRLRTIGWGLVTGLLWLAMGIIIPFYVAVAWAIAGASLIVLALRERRLPWAEAYATCAAGLLSAPIMLYSAWRFTSDPVYAAWAAQNQVLSPHPLHYLAAYGVPLGLAAFAVRDAWLSEKPTWLTLAWVGVVPLLIYLPFNLQRRLVEGVQAPLSLLAAMGFTKIANLKSSIPDLREKTLTGILLLILLPTNAIVVAGSIGALKGRPGPIFRDRGEIAALEWLSERGAPSEVVLASYQTGNYLPARVHARAFVGHGPETVRAAEKKALVARFFDATTDDLWRRELLGAYGVDYVVWGPAERRLGAFDPGQTQFLTPAYVRGRYTVYRVK
jgi:hypothetical protein